MTRSERAGVGRPGSAGRGWRAGPGGRDCAGLGGFGGGGGGGRGGGGGGGEVHDAVGQGGEAEGYEVAGVVLAEPPGAVGALAGEDAGGAADVAGGEVDDRARRGVVLGWVDLGDAGAGAGCGQVVEQATDVLRGEVGAEGPGVVRVTDAPGKVRYAAEHHALVDERVVRVHDPAVDRQLDVAEC